MSPPRVRVAMVLALVTAPLTYLAGAWILSAAVARWPWIGAFVLLDPGAGGFDWLTTLRTPLGSLAVMAFVLLLELTVRGWRDSALRRLFVAPTDSSLVDLFYLTLRAAGGVHVLAFVFSLGSAYWLANRIHLFLDIGILRDRGFAVQFFGVYLAHSFFFYWGHRLMHTRWFWAVHKVHHAAEELNVVTPLRNHPVDLAVMTVLHAFPAAVLGASPLVVVAHAAVNGLYQALVHTEFRVRSRLLEQIWVTPAAHRVHHSNRAEHFDHNFGILTIWDRLFGTYRPPVAEPLVYGVADGHLFNRRAHLREVAANVRRWLGGSPP